ncbi:ATP-binding protein [Singulisphaera sp. PoT]|uniref:ATP-binding protein n=1 Tax=Singulisphaera sp. PoT TaxID=3411797 RepID=UPI003BF60098
MSEITLNNCEDEPIRIPGAVQPHGALIAIGAEDGVISHASENLADFFGVAPLDAIGLPLATLFDEVDYSRVADGINRLKDDASPKYLYTVRPKGGPAGYDAIVHRAGGRTILEFEPMRSAGGASVADLYRLTQGAVTRLRKASDLGEMYDICAHRVREIAGFDRVMVYRFDDDWNGIVIAESKRDDLEPFFGLHYPASDIPKQARDLYVQNWLRFIADRDYAPVPILPPSGPESPAPLDLSQSVLRSVSPIHLEYLRNMGVGASMSISLLKDNRLWGLVACHHYSPKYVPYDIRTACELLGQVMSMQLVSREEQERAKYGHRMNSVRLEIADRLWRMEQVGIALIDVEPTILDLLEASGAAVIHDNEVTRIGLTPAVEEILQICELLEAREVTEVFHTDSLGSALGLPSIGAVAAGLLAISMRKRMRDWVMWFRPEQVREVDWAGDPSKTVEKGDGAVRLSPRGSFALWKQVVRGKSQPWTASEIAAANDLRRDLAEAMLGRAADLVKQNRVLRRGDVEKEEMLASERAARSEAERLGRMKDEFVATLSHELRTPLNAIIGWSQILRRAHDTEDIREAGEVIERNARIQATMIEDLLDASRITSGKLRLDMQQVDLTSTVSAALETVAPAAQAKGVRIERLLDTLHRVHISGDPTRLQQVFWNLLSNAVKFTPRGGKIQVLIERIDSHVEVSVSDTGQGIDPKFIPHVFDRFRQQDAATNRKHGGLGLGLSIVRHLVELHGGTIFVRSEGDGQGSTFVVSLPVRAVANEGRRTGVHPTREMSPIEDDQIDLNGVKILIVDDETDAREMMSRVLEECGAEVVTAGSGEEGLARFQGAKFDVIVSDIGMPGLDGYEFIKQLRNLESSLGRPRCPAVALTAYARPEDRRKVLLSGYQIHLAKPVEFAELTAVIANLVDKI